MHRRIRSSTSTVRSTLPILVIAALLAAPTPASGAVLHDQTDNTTFGNRGSNDWDPPNDGFDDQLADDFTVPAGQSWQISQLDVLGLAFGSSHSVNVFIYANAGSLPGAQLFAQTVSGGTIPDYSLLLTGAPNLAPGTYWISAQQAGTTSGEGWYWRERSVQSGNPAAYRNQGGTATPACLDWTMRTSCYPGTNPDQLFKLSGTATPIAPPAAAPTGQRAAALKKCKKKRSKKARKKCRKKANKLPA